MPVAGLILHGKNSSSNLQARICKLLQAIFGLIYWNHFDGYTTSGDFLIFDVCFNEPFDYHKLQFCTLFFWFSYFKKRPLAPVFKPPGMAGLVHCFCIEYFSLHECTELLTCWPIETDKIDKIQLADLSLQIHQSLQICLIVRPKCLDVILFVCLFVDLAASGHPPENLEIFTIGAK